MYNDKKSESPFNSLAKREVEIAKCLLKGLKTTEIATYLNIKSNTVSTVKRTLFYKLKVSNLVEFLKLALENDFA